MLLTLKEVVLGLRDSVTRVPFRYGKACLTECPQAVVEVAVEFVPSTLVRGYSGDCLPPLWFDKSPEKSYEQQLDEMQQAIGIAARCYLQEFRSSRRFFSGWYDAHQAAVSQATGAGLPELLASFGSSFLERAILDAVCRLCGLPFFDALQLNVFGIQPGLIHPELRHSQPRNWLPPRPRKQVWLRQTVGLGDPLTVDETHRGNWPRDGYPVCLEEYLRDYQVRYFKVKLSRRLDQDIQRLCRFAELVEKYRATDYKLTLDGNELYDDPEELLATVESIQRHPRLANLWTNTVAIEQPLPRHVAFDLQYQNVIRNLCAQKPVIIDESDSQLSTFRLAADFGYRGVSSKNCKGVIKSILNAGLIAWHNQHLDEPPWMLTGEDLCSVGVIAVQSDLCLAAALGIDHVERNGHHYHRGLSYLPDEEQQEALFWHGDFYAQHHNRIAPHIREGKFILDSLQCVGCGFAVLPRMNHRRCTRWEGLN